MLLPYLNATVVEAGCDEAGRGCLAGPVFAAAVILKPDFVCEELNDSKQLSELQRNRLRITIEQQALAWAVASISPEEIDKINILNASILAMHQAIERLAIRPQSLIIDGNRFKQYGNIPYTTIVKGDGKYMSIAAASILAKTHRDEYMSRIAEEFPVYGWKDNKGYPTENHRFAISKYGVSPYHRMSFRLLPLEKQMTIDFGID